MMTKLFISLICLCSVVVPAKAEKIIDEAQFFEPAARSRIERLAKQIWSEFAIPVTIRTLEGPQKTNKSFDNPNVKAFDPLVMSWISETKAEFVRQNGDDGITIIFTKQHGFVIMITGKNLTDYGDFLPGDQEYLMKTLEEEAAKGKPVVALIKTLKEVLSVLRNNIGSRQLAHGTESTSLSWANHVQKLLPWVAFGFVFVLLGLLSLVLLKNGWGLNKLPLPMQKTENKV